MAHLHLVPAATSDVDAECEELKAEIIRRGGVRVDQAAARKRIEELEAELAVMGRKLSIAPRAVRAQRARRILESMDLVIQEDDGEVA